MKLFGRKIDRLIRLGLGVLGAVIATLMLERPAEASLAICNGSDRQSTAFVFTDNVRVAGPITLGSDQCFTVFGGSFDNRDYVLNYSFMGSNEGHTLGFRWNNDPMKWPICLPNTSPGAGCLEPDPEMRPYTTGGPTPGCPRCDTITEYISSNPEASFRRGMIFFNWGSLRAARNAFSKAEKAFGRYGNYGRLNEARRMIEIIDRRLSN